MRTAVRRLLPGLTVAVLAMSGCGRSGLPPVPVPPVPSASPAVEKGCVRFAAALPKSLKIGKDVELKRRRTDPAELRLAAYGDPAVVIRCGVPHSPNWKAGGPAFTAAGVSWFPEEQADGAVVYSMPTAFVDIEVRVPSAYRGELLVLLSDAARAAQPLTSSG